MNWFGGSNESSVAARGLAMAAAAALFLLYGSAAEAQYSEKDLNEAFDRGYSLGIEHGGGGTGFEGPGVDMNSSDLAAEPAVLNLYRQGIDMNDTASYIAIGKSSFGTVAASGQDSWYSRMREQALKDLLDRDDKRQ